MITRLTGKPLMPVFEDRSFSSAINRHKLLENVFWLSSLISSVRNSQVTLAAGGREATHLEAETANSRRRRRCYGCAC